eukprot:9501148-Lingulodinium_polyedra.AAC.1
MPSQEGVHPARVLRGGDGAELLATHCPPGGPRKAYCLLCLTHAPAPHRLPAAQDAIGTLPQSQGRPRPC